MNTLADALTHDFLAKLENIAIAVNNRVNSGYNGIRAAKTKGSSLEFSDYRDYSVGDDIRRIDWNSYGRLERLFIKLYSEEKQATFNIFWDKSKSMSFGDKGIHAKLIAVSLAYIALNNADRVNLFAFDENISFTKANISSKALFPKLVKFLDNIQPSNKTDFNQSLISNKKLGTGISFILSDFFMTNYNDTIKFLQNKQQNVFLVHILSKEELLPDYSQKVRLIDSETQEFYDIDMNADAILLYQNELQTFCSEIKTFCSKRKIGYILSSTDTHVLKTISDIANCNL